jgi:hypothetical protein
MLMSRRFYLLYYRPSVPILPFLLFPFFSFFTFFCLQKTPEEKIRGQDILNILLPFYLHHPDKHLTIPYPKSMQFSHLILMLSATFCAAQLPTLTLDTKSMETEVETVTVNTVVPRVTPPVRRKYCGGCPNLALRKQFLGGCCVQ